MSRREQKQSKRELIALSIAKLLGFVTGLVFTALCLFLLVLITHDFPTARDYILLGGKIPEDIFKIGGVVIVVSLSIGIGGGIFIWIKVFEGLGLATKSNEGDA